MPGLDSLSIPGLDLAAGTFTLPVWAAGIALALIVLLLLLVIFRSGIGELSNLLFRVAIVVAAVVFGWMWLDKTNERDRADERRALDQRAVDLAVRAAAPGSMVACLESTTGDNVEGACERAIFANPETVAAAAAFVGARLTLLRDAQDFAARKDQNYENSATVAALRRAIAADRFGLTSQVLAARDGCTFDNCDVFQLIGDPNRLRSNLRERAFDGLVARYAANWPGRAKPIVAPGPNVTFPSSSSIPPVSIMNNEPAPQAAAPPAAPAPAAAPSGPAPSTPQPAAKRPTPARTAQPKQQPASSAPPPVQLGPPPAAAAPPATRSQ